MIISVFTRGVVMSWKPHKSGLLACSLAREERMVRLTAFMEFSQSCRLAVPFLPWESRCFLVGSHLVLCSWTRCKEAETEWGEESMMCVGTPKVTVRLLRFDVGLLAVWWLHLRLSCKVKVECLQRVAGGCLLSSMGWHAPSTVTTMWLLVWRIRHATEAEEPYLEELGFLKGEITMGTRHSGSIFHDDLWFGR